jgi:hypothetical protein
LIVRHAGHDATARPPDCAATHGRQLRNDGGISRRHCGRGSRRVAGARTPSRHRLDRCESRRIDFKIVIGAVAGVAINC